MRTAGVIIFEVAAKYALQVTIINHDDVVKTLSANGAKDFGGLWPHPRYPDS